MPPYWSLGFQLCRYGYNSLAKVKETVKRMNDYDIPQDVQYGDIDYMNRQLDFTINPKTYKGLEDYVRELKKTGIRYISILVSFQLICRFSSSLFLKSQSIDPVIELPFLMLSSSLSKLEISSPYSDFVSLHVFTLQATVMLVL